MGFATVKLLFDISPDELHAQVKRHVSIYKPRREPEEFAVEVYAGLHCSAVQSRQIACPDMFLYPLGHELAALWMDVRYQDGDTWDLSCYSTFDHEVSHSVNPWPYNEKYVYDDESVQDRIAMLRKLLPQFADVIPPYLLLWKYPKDPTQPTKLTKRTGKARPTDQHEYGDADQYSDFLKCFGINLDTPKYTVKVRI